MKPIRSLFFGVLFLTVISFSAFGQSTTPKVVTGYNQSLVLTENGSLYSFGGGHFGTAGQSNTNRVDIPGLANDPALNGQKVVDIATAYDNEHAIVLLADGRMFGIGSNDRNQLALSGSNNYTTLTEITHANFEGHTIVDVEAGEKNSIFRTASGKVFVIGDNPYGFIGVGTTTNPITEPTLINGMQNKKVVEISSGRQHVLLRTDSSEVWVYGRNSNGDLGIGNSISTYSPVRMDQNIPGETIIKAVAGGVGSSYFVTDSGKVFSTGVRLGPLGYEPPGGPNVDVNTPTEITHSNLQGKTIIDVVGNQESATLLASDGTVFSFGGRNGEESLGRPLTDIIVPVKLTHSNIVGKNIVEISSEDSEYTYMRASDGTILTFGGPFKRQSWSSASRSSGTGRWRAGEAFPRPVIQTEMNGKTVAKMYTSLYMNYFVTTDSLIYSFGHVYSTGFRGNSMRSNLPTVKSPTLIPSSKLGNASVKNVFAGHKQTYVVNANNAIYQFGQNSYAELGRTDSLDHYDPVLMNASLIDNKIVKQIVVGAVDTLSVTFIVTEDGAVYGFGDNNFGQLGLGDNNRRAQPVRLTHANLSGKKIIHVASSGRATLLVASDGTAFTFGYGLDGNLGHGTSVNLNVPTALTHATITAKKIISGSIVSRGVSSFILLNEDGQLITFGENSDGQLGQGDKVDNSTPRVVTHESIVNKKVIKVQSNRRGTIILTDDGKTYAFGNGKHIGFNVGTFTDLTVPTLIESANVSGRFAVDIATDYEHSLLLLDNGTVVAASFAVTILDVDHIGKLGQSDPTQNHLAHVFVPNFSTYLSPIPTTNLKMHVDAGRGLTTFGDSLNSWGDLSGNNNNLTQSILLQRPVLVDSAINNQRTIGFNGTNSYMVSPTTGTLGIQNSDYEVFMVAKTTSATNEIDFLLAGSNENFELHTNGTSGLRFIPNAGNYTDVGSVGDFSDGTAQLINVRASSTTSTVAANRSGKTQISVNAQSSVSAQLFVGVRTGGTFWFGGQIAEIIIYKNVLSDNDRRKVESYLFKKYAIKNYKESSQKLTGAEGWRIMTSPVADSSFAPLLGSFWTQGFTGANHSGGASNVYRWPNTSTSLSNSNWTSVSNMSDSLHPGEGVLVYVFSDDNGPGVAGNAGFPKTLKLEGREPKGTQSLTPLLNSNVNGWALVGNPFRNDVDWDGFTRSGLSNSVYVYDINSASWKSWNGTLGSLTDGEVGPFNAFFVQTTEASPTLNIPVSAKTDSAKRFLGKQFVKSEPTYFSIELSDSSGLKNKAWFQFSEDGEFGLDASDAHQLNPLSSNYVTLASILNDTTHLDINSLPIITEPFEIPLALQTSASGTTHHISKGDLNIPEGWEISLYDSEFDITTDLEESYEFTMDAAKVKKVQTQDIASPPSLKSIFQTAKQKRSGPRFALTVMPSQTVSNEPLIDLPNKVELGQNYPNPFNPSTTIAYGVPNTGKVTLEVFDILGRKVATLLNGENKSAGRYTLIFNASNLASGMYIYRLRAGNTVMIKKLTLIK
jgi:alpha-tubulin suppressor-like RCC1 family protein